MAGQRKLKTVDVHLGTPPFDPDCRAFQTGSVNITSLYSHHLARLGGVPAMASHLRIFIDKTTRAIVPDPPPTRIDMGFLETVVSGMDQSIPTAETSTRQHLYLEWLQQIVLVMAEARNWDASIFEAAYQGCLVDDLRFRLEVRKLSPDRRFLVKLELTFDDAGAVLAIVIANRAGTEMAGGQFRFNGGLLAGDIMRYVVKRIDWVDLSTDHPAFTTAYLDRSFRTEFAVN